MKLNLGAADRKIEGFVSVDIAGDADVLVDLAAPWPWKDSSIEEILALDVIEHIGDCDHLRSWCFDCARERGGMPFGMKLRHPLGRIHFMNELHRVLVPGARVTIETPNAARGCGYWQDPTHVSPWCLSSFKYFEDGAFARGRLGPLYGITARFRIDVLNEFETNGENEREKAWKIRAVMEAIK